MFQKNIDVVSRLGHERNVARVLVTDIVREARGLTITPASLKPFGEKNLVPELKPIIGLVAKVDGPTAAGEMFDVNIKTAIAARDANKDRIEEQLEPVRTLAIERLSAAISMIDDEKLHDIGALNLSNIARNLSTVIGNTRKKEEGEAGSKFQFNIIAPSVSVMKDYEVLDV